MKNEHKILLFSIFLGVLAWVIDGFLEFILYKNISLLGSLFTAITIHEFYFRSILFILFTCFGIIMMKVTQRRRLIEEKLREDERRFRGIVTHMPFMVQAFDEEGRIIFWNLESERITQYSRDEIMASPNAWERLYPDVARQNEIKEKWLHEIQDFYDWRCPITCKNQSIRTISWSSISHSQPIPGWHSWGIGIDITERIQAEEERALMEKQLRHSQKMEAVGQLVGGIAHDFNNMIMAVQGYAECIQQELDNDSPLQKDIHEIIKAGQRTASLTRQLLAFSRQQILQPRPLDLNEILLDMDHMLRHLIGEDIDLETDTSDDLNIVEADPIQIEQIIMNLALNARDAMPQGGKLTLETSNAFLDENYVQKHADAHVGNHVMLAVSDTGSGIDADTLEHIFEPFFTTKEMGRGTGLGLSTVYGIVKQSGGNIWVYSELGEGTTFKIYFPVSTDFDRAEKRVSITSESLTGTETLLVVEDDTAVQDYIVRILQSKGYTVHAANEGQEAIQFCESLQEPLHLILTDVIMPEMSGKQMANTIQAIFPEVKILYMSGYTDNVIVHHGILEPGIHLIQKPVSTNELLQRIRLVLDS